MKFKCDCGAIKYEIKTEPLFRFYCHCSLCKKFNKQEFADIRVYFKKQLMAFPKGEINFIEMKENGIPRGICVSCQKPAIETMDLPMLPKLVLVPGNMLKDSGQDNTVDFHMYYESREMDLCDNSPKYSSHLSSQLAFTRSLFKSLHKIFLH